MESEVTLPPAWQLNWLATARFSWIVVTLALIAVFIAGMQPRYRELTAICTEEPCIALTLEAHDAELLKEPGGSLHGYAIYHNGLEILVSGVLALLGGQESALAIVISTLGIAALFNPLRQRVQLAIDRRSYRRKYDAELALSQFAAIARSEVDLTRLNAALIQISHETLQPKPSRCR